MLSNLESIQAKEYLKSEEKLCIWANPVVEGEENEKADQEKNEVVIQLLMILYTDEALGTDDIPTTDENTDETNTDEAAKEAIKAKAEGGGELL